MPAGEVSPAGLIAIGEVARDYGLYSKVTGGTSPSFESTSIHSDFCQFVGQRIDLFGAQKADLPDIWERLNNAGFESGSAYGKSLRTVSVTLAEYWTLH